MRKGHGWRAVLVCVVLGWIGSGGAIAAAQDASSSGGTNQSIGLSINDSSTPNPPGGDQPGGGGGGGGGNSSTRTDSNNQAPGYSSSSLPRTGLSPAIAVIAILGLLSMRLRGAWARRS